MKNNQKLGYEPTFGDDLPGRFQILALDGGGVKAIFTAHVLARLEEDTGVRIVDVFDLIVGTSAGGIIALALGVEMAPREIADRYVDLARRVFPTWRRYSPARLLRVTYSQRTLRRALHGVLGDQVLGDSAKRLVITSFDPQRGTVHLFKTPHNCARRSHRVDSVVEPRRRDAEPRRRRVTDRYRCALNSRSSSGSSGAVRPLDRKGSWELNPSRQT